MNPLIVLATIGIILMAGCGSPSGAEAGELSTANETSTGTTTPDKNVSELTLIEAFDAGELNSTQVLNYMNETGLTLDDVYDSDWYANASATRQATRDAAIATNQDALTTSLGSSNSKEKSNKNKGKSNNNKGKSNNNKGKSNKKSSNDKQCQGSCQNGCPMPGNNNKWPNYNQCMSACNQMYNYPAPDTGTNYYNPNQLNWQGCLGHCVLMYPTASGFSNSQKTSSRRRSRLLALLGRNRQVH